MWKWEVFTLVVLITFSAVKCFSEKIDCAKNGTQADYCPTACPETCDSKGKPNCILICGGPCVCKPGYIVNRMIPACVLQSDCPRNSLPKGRARRLTNFSCFSGENTCPQLKHSNGRRKVG
ncbi:accessory gland protein Acp62F [Drosophila santomea]|uniref:accessory gland protein Acp62F n=1 Tax=Drosophila santomea TaxID=129105 RepID=UPI001CC9C5B0|nr:accessory gland protein Acp62F [Drosophila santomea]